MKYISARIQRDSARRRFFVAASSAELAEVYRTLGRSVTTPGELEDLTAWFVSAALVALLLASALALAWFARLP